MALKGIKKVSQLSAQTGIPDKVLYEIIRDKRQVYQEEAKAIVNALGLDVKDIKSIFGSDVLSPKPVEISYKFSDLKAKLLALQKELGYAPGQNYVARNHSKLGLAHPTTYVKKFGMPWNDILRKSGLEPRRLGRDPSAKEGWVWE